MIPSASQAGGGAFPGQEIYPLVTIPTDGYDWGVERGTGMGISRRKLLWGGVAGGVGLGAAGTLGLRLGAPAPGALVLTAEEWAVVEAVAEVMFPGAPFPVDGVQAGVARETDRLLHALMDGPRRAAFRYVLRTLEWGTLASRGRRFTALPPAERKEVLETWSSPEVLARRVAGDSLRAVLGMAYFAHPEVIAAMGWRTGCNGEAA